MNNSYEYFYTAEMIEAMGGIENVNRFVEGHKKLKYRLCIKVVFRKLAVSIIKVALIFGIIDLIFRIFM